jgi:clan AA aspartic protease
MGYVYCDVRIGNPSKEKVLSQRMLVDTGATYASIPKKLAKELGLPAIMATKMTLADGREIEATYSLAYVEINGRGDGVQVMIFDIAEPVIGVFTLEALGLAVDPSTGELKPTRGFISRA